METGPIGPTGAIGHHEYKPPIDLWASDGLTWSNGGAQSGTYLDMIGKQYKENREREKKGARTGFER